MQQGRLSKISTLESVWQLPTRIKLDRSYLFFLSDYEHEVFACIFLNNQNEVLAIEEMFRGTIDGASVYPREVVKRCLEVNAAAVIFAHNHPSGDTTPSRADINITKVLIDALGLVDIRVLDHIIVGDGNSYSLAENGHI